MCAVISAVYEKIYNEKLEWNLEISRVIAISEKYFRPVGWNTVYYVNPYDLLKRGYDKIIILQRDLESFYYALVQYRLPGLTVEETMRKHPEWFELMNFYYGLVYQKIESPKVFRVQLSDLNNYTVATFSELFDFLEFPREVRPVLVPINPQNRNWQVSASILKKGWALDPMQKKILKENPNQLIPIETDEPDSKEYAQPTISNPEINPYKMSSEEYQIQKAYVYRILPEPMPDALKELGVVKY